MATQAHPTAPAPRGNETVIYPPTVPLLIKRISWGAIFAGLVVVLAVQVLLAMLGTGIGLSTIDPLQQGDSSPSASAFSIGAGIWWLVSSLIALYLGGWVAGRVSGVARPVDGALHGLLTWAVALLATVYLVSSAGSSLLSGASSVLGTAVTATATAGAAAAPKIADAAGDQLKQAGVTWDSVKREAMQLLSQTGKPALQPDNVQQQAKDAVAGMKNAPNGGASSDQDLSGALERLLSVGKAAATQADRDAVINVVVARTGASREEAAKRVAGWEDAAEQAKAKAQQAADQAKQKAREVADATAKNVSRAMLLGFVALALGALAAYFGGSAGQRKSTAYVG